MYKVFFKDSYFLLTDDQNLLKSKSIGWLHKDFNETKRLVFSLLNRDFTFHAIIIHHDIEDLFTIFKSCFIYVKAAGGVIKQNNQILLIKRNGMVDLPKGHQEKGETIEQCAIREVEEECGLHHVEIIKPLEITFHIYYQNENWHLKKNHWFIMNCPPSPTLYPQTEEEIEMVYWFPLEKIHNLFSCTYPSLQSVLEKLL